MRGPIPHWSRISASVLIRVNVYCLQHRQDNILNFNNQRTHAHFVFVQAFPARSHSRPQSPSFLGHVVLRGSLQIKPSGSGDENGPFASDTSPKWFDRERRENAVQEVGKVFLRRQSNSEGSALLSGPLRKQKLIVICDWWISGSVLCVSRFVAFELKSSVARNVSSRERRLGTRQVACCFYNDYTFIFSNWR